MAVWLCSLGITNDEGHTHTHTHTPMPHGVGRRVGSEVVDRITLEAIS